MLSSDVAFFIFHGGHILNSAVSLVDRRRHFVRLHLVGSKHNFGFVEWWAIALRPESGLSRTGCSDLAVLLNKHFPGVSFLNESSWMSLSGLIRFAVTASLLFYCQSCQSLMWCLVISITFQKEKTCIWLLGWYYLSARLWLLFFPEFCLAEVLYFCPSMVPLALVVFLVRHKSADKICFLALDAWLFLTFYCILDETFREMFSFHWNIHVCCMRQHIPWCSEGQ